MAWQSTETKIDDAIALLETVADVSATVSGSIVAIGGVIIPIVAMLAPINPELQFTSFGVGGLFGGAGAAIARQKPTLKKNPPTESEDVTVLLNEY